ncbi:MAG TPA: MarR family transcriptional regulator [Acidimicrobiales bacterium]
MATTRATYASPGHLVRRASQLHTQIFDEVYEGIVTPRQFAVLIALDRRPGIDQITLSNLVAIDRTTIGGMVSRLAARGYIHDIADPCDGRRKLLRLTPEGERLLETLVPRIGAVTDRLLAPLTPAERTTFLELLAKIATVEDSTFPGYRASVLAELSRPTNNRRR